MHYLMPDGCIKVNFERASTVLNIQTAFTEAVVEQPHLQATYLFLHPKLPLDYLGRLAVGRLKHNVGFAIICARLEPSQSVVSLADAPGVDYIYVSNLSLPHSQDNVIT
jgi:hypothetical protein